MHQLQGTLTPIPPFDFDKSLQFLGHFRPALGEQRTADGVLTKASRSMGRSSSFASSPLAPWTHPNSPTSSVAMGRLARTCT